MSSDRSAPGVTRALSRVFTRFCIAALAMVVVAPAHAHPHGWVDYTVRVLFDDLGQVTGLQMTWKIDPIYSLTLLEDMNLQGGRVSEAELDRLGSDIVTQLGKEHYLTHLYSGREELSLGQVTDYTTLMSDQRIEFMFVLPLSKPQPSKDTTLSWKVYDPTYFIEFLYDNKVDAPLTLAGAPDDCTAKVVHFKPDPKLVAKAAAIDVTGKAPEGLGALFADTGVLTCGAP